MSYLASPWHAGQTCYQFLSRKACSFIRFLPCLDFVIQRVVSSGVQLCAPLFKLIVKSVATCLALSLLSNLLSDLTSGNCAQSFKAVDKLVAFCLAFILLSGLLSNLCRTWRPNVCTFCPRCCVLPCLALAVKSVVMLVVKCWVQMRAPSPTPNLPTAFRQSFRYSLVFHFKTTCLYAW